MLGDKAHPLRCSKLQSLIHCNMRVYLVAVLDCEDDEGGVPAQNGSLTHAGVAGFHKFKGTLLQKKKAAWDAIKAHAEKFPLAEVEEVRLFITPYMDDPRNIEAEFYKLRVPKLDKRGKETGKFDLVEMIEYPVEFVLPAHPMDVTGCDIHVQGTLDQIRILYKLPKVCDYKTGRISGFQMQHDYIAQLAAYTYGARALGVENCEIGPIIRGYGYRARDAIPPSPAGVFIDPPVLYDKVEDILEAVRLHVALYRMGHINYGPGPHCTYCEFGGLNQCSNKFVEVQQKLALIQSNT